MSEKPAKPVKTLELHAEIEASPEAVFAAISEGGQVANWFSPEAHSEGRGAGSKLTFAWSEEMRWTTSVDVWEEGKRLRWFDSPSMMGEGTALACEWIVEGSGGKTRLTLVQSAFGGEEAGWDDLFLGMEMGWTYFLYHLRVYLESMPGKKRHMISARLPAKAPRDAAWRKVLSAEAGLLEGGSGAVAIGERVQLKIGEGTVPAQVDLAVPGRILALRMAEQDAILFLEFEMGEEAFHVGAWLSVHDAQHAQRMREGALRTFERVRAALE
jgi:uncharacterized protein YndB with AHSA1/START domain